MKFKNILGKDFNTKKDAYSHFKSMLYAIEKPVTKITARANERHLKFTESTLIKHSDMDYLFDNYLTKDEKTLYEVFRGNNKPFSWWCKFQENGHTRNLGFELKARRGGLSIIPVRPKRIFTCFASTTNNQKANEKRTARNLITYQSKYFLRDLVAKKLAKESREIAMDFINFQDYECEKCKFEVPYKMIQVDHVIPFREIYKEWRENVWTGKLTTKSTKLSFAEKEANKSWENFHKNLCIYQVLCKECHNYKTYEQKL